MASFSGAAATASGSFSGAPAPGAAPDTTAPAHAASPEDSAFDRQVAELVAKVEATGPLKLSTNDFADAPAPSMKWLVFEVKHGTTATPGTWDKAHKKLLEATCERLSETAKQRLLRELVRRKHGEAGLPAHVADSLGAVHAILVEMLEEGLATVSAKRDSLCAGGVAWETVLSRHEGSSYQAALILLDLVSSTVPNSVALLSNLHSVAWQACQSTLLTTNEKTARAFATSILYLPGASSLLWTHFNYVAHQVHLQATPPPVQNFKPYVASDEAKANTHAMVLAGLPPVANMALSYTHKGVSCLLTGQHSESSQ
jgi:hypothetical protein